MSDPKLKEAMAEIKALLMKHDLAGYVFIASPTYSEFMHKLDASWSAITIDKNVFALRAKEAELGSKEAVHKKAEQTAHILCALQDLCVQGYGLSGQILDAMKTVYEIEHKSFTGFEPHYDS